LGIGLVLLPPFRQLVHKQLGKPLPPWIWLISGVVLFGLFMLLSSMSRPSSIYTSPEAETKLMEIYEARLAEWPVPYESVFLETTYGQVHVIISGPEEAPPVLLLHASGVSAWSWLYNIEALSQHYRTYAIDTIGDAGKSRLRDIKNYPQTGQELARLYTEIADQLGVERASVVGASQGGSIGTNYALYAPERVEKLILLGPMGYAGTNSSVARIVFATFFPLKPVQENTIRWAFGDDAGVLAAYEEWFRIYMSGVFSQQSRPAMFSPEQLQSLQMPVLLVLGQKDNLVGDPARARDLAQSIPNLRVEILNTGHLIGVEQPDQVNELIIEFFGTDNTSSKK